ncbi:peptide/nickel transport system ATP-binding protein [Salibacterium salarium]|uniref:ABC transporter ATP-binding protein n=1 Tax=Salibacterium salarium TaxID=284579 RepID=UPI002784886D|nr:ABC transporter ATP-binding protein [Salibacterium salarium]MDQ0298367.1 peptide/nickel transport system ATP-binding protein [Salibacterium salarium]
MTNNKIILKINNIKTSFKIEGGFYEAVDGVSINVYENEVLAIVGESGCGKSALAYSIMGLHERSKTMVEGDLLFKGQNINDLTESSLNKIRGKEIGMIFQDPLAALNPLMKAGHQIEEVLILHTNMTKNQRYKKVISLLDEVGIPSPDTVYQQYPHELSGGMRQRVIIAIAIACAPSLLIADEPTTALDATIQGQIIELLENLKLSKDAGVLLITHDLGVVAEIADRVAVMYAGELVEIADVKTLFKTPQHPYTRSLLNSVPSVSDLQSQLHVIQGKVPPIQHLPRKGCRFKERIPWIRDEAHESHPELHEVARNHYVRCTCYKDFYFQNVTPREEKPNVYTSST